MYVLNKRGGGDIPEKSYENKKQLSAIPSHVSLLAFSLFSFDLSGGVVAKSLGAIAVMYSSIHALASIQFDEDTEAKSIFAGTLTGALFKSTAGIKKCAVGGAFGFGLAALWAIFLKKDERVSYYV